MSNPVLPSRRQPRYLAKCAAIALWGFSLILFIMQLPWIAVKMNPGSLEPEMESLKTQAMITFSPLFLALGTMATALFFLVVQNKFLAAAALEQGKTVGKRELRRLFLPFVRQQEIKHLLGDIPLLKAAGACLFLFWLLYAVLGLLSPLPPYFLLAGVLLFFAAAKNLSAEKLSAVLRFWAMALFVIFCLSTANGFAALNSQTEKTAGSGIPADRKELKRLIYQNDIPDETYSRMAQSAIRADNKKFLLPLIEAQHIYTVSQEWRQKAAENWGDPQLHAYFLPLTRKLDSGKVICQDLYLDTPGIWHTGGKWFFSRIAGAYYSTAVFAAIEKKNKKEMMTNFRRLDSLFNGLQRGDFIISLSYIFLNELNRSAVVGAMLGSGMLSLKELDELARLNKGREEKFKTALLTALQGEALFEKELIGEMAKIYPWLQSSDVQANQFHENRIVKFFLRGYLPFPPHVWNAVMTKRSLESSRFKFDFLLNSLQKSASYPLWEKQLPELEGYLKENSSYFVLLNYQATRTAIAQLHHAVTCIRLTDLAIEIEKFRLTKKRLPKDLSELKIKIPTDAVSGEKLTYDGKKMQLYIYRDNKPTIKTLPGWQVCGTAKEHINLSVPAVCPLAAADGK